MNCKQTPSQPQDCPYWNGVKCCDVNKFVNRETGEEMCRFNSSAVHHSEYRETSVESESALSASSNTQSKQALREIAASISAEAGFSKNENYRVPSSVLERWAQQLLAL